MKIIIISRYWQQQRIAYVVRKLNSDKIWKMPNNTFPVNKLTEYQSSAEWNSTLLYLYSLKGMYLEFNHSMHRIRSFMLSNHPNVIS